MFIFTATMRKRISLCAFVAFFVICILLLCLIEFNWSPLNVFVFENYISSEGINNIVSGMIYGLLPSVLVYLLTAYIPEQKSIEVKKYQLCLYYETLKRNVHNDITIYLENLKKGITDIGVALESNDFDYKAMVEYEKYVSEILLTRVERLQNMWVIFNIQVCSLGDVYLRSDIKRRLGNKRVEKMVNEILSMNADLGEMKARNNKNRNGDYFRQLYAIEKTIFEELKQVSQVFFDNKTD